jgi:CRP-like cAMP-binding protein
MDNITLLKNVGFLAGLKKKDLKGLVEFCLKRSYKKGETLVNQGDPGLGLYIIIAGKVEIIKKTASGSELKVAIHGPGDFFGEMAVLDDAPRSASVIALEDTECLFLTAEDFKARLKSHPEIALEILPIVVNRFRETNKMLLSLSRL